jgi:hypothetical protein
LLREVQLSAGFTGFFGIYDEDRSTGLAYLQGRAATIVEILHILDTHAGLRLADGPIPYSFDRVTANEGIPMAGYTDPDGQVRPSHLASALVLRWRDVLAADDPIKTEQFRLFRSAAWIAAEQGIVAGVGYLIDLVAYGQVLQDEAAGNAIATLLVASSEQLSPEQFQTALWSASEKDDSSSRHSSTATKEIAQIAGQNDWWATSPARSWMAPVSPNPTMEPLVERLLESGLAARQAVLRADTLDEWLIALSRLFRQVAAIQIAISAALRQVPITVRTIISQLEEIGGDAPALMGAFELGSLPACIDYQDQVRDAMTSADHERGKQRFRAERQLISDEMLIRPTPADWFTPSWRIAAAYVGWHTGGGASPFVPGGPVHPDGPSPEESSQRVLAALGRITERLAARDYDGGGRTALRLIYDYPWCDIAHWQVEQAFYLNGQHQAAAESLLPALALQPLQANIWDSLMLCLNELQADESATVAGLVSQHLADRPPPLGAR